MGGVRVRVRARVRAGIRAGVRAGVRARFRFRVRVRYRVRVRVGVRVRVRVRVPLHQLHLVFRQLTALAKGQVAAHLCRDQGGAGFGQLALYIRGPHIYVLHADIRIHTHIYAYIHIHIYMCAHIYICIHMARPGGLGSGLGLRVGLPA